MDGPERVQADTDPEVSEPYVHEIRTRYGEVDAQGVVFNAHWLTYFDDAITQFFAWLGYDPKTVFFEGFDFMLVKAVVEWRGPAGFDDVVMINVRPSRLGNSSFDMHFDARVEDRPVCEATITYVAIDPESQSPQPIPDKIRAELQAAG
jgi:acyl-CoA thioester hydrolase